MATLRNDTVIRSADGQGTAAIVTASNIGTYGVATNSTYYVGTTQNIFNRASGAQTLTGVSIDGNAATVTNGVYTTGDQTISGIKYFTSTVDPSTVPAGYAGGYLYESTTGFGTYGIIFGSATGQHGAIGYSSNTMYFGTENGTDNTLNTKATLSSGGAFTATGDVRAPIFYDSANTAYYLDPASTSNLVGLTVANTITGSVSGNAATATNVAWTGITGGARTNYLLEFQPPISSYAGFAFKTSAAGEAGYFLVRGTSDNDVYTAEGITLVADAGWLTLAQRTTASRGVRIMTGTSSAERLKITTAGDVQIVNGNTFTYNSNVVLHAGNYTSYPDATKLPLAGGTLTGNLTITKASAYLYLNGTNSDSELRFLANSSDRWAMGMNVGDATENLNIYNYTTATTNFTILKASGNVGVGTASPSYKLDVSGAINASTYVYAGVFYDNDNTVYYTNPSGTSNLVGLTVANTITGSVSGSSASCTGNAATATTSALLTSSDVRTISPSSANASRLTYGFTSYSNNNTGSWADYLHLRSYADSSGGNDNLIMFNKSVIGMRIWQQAFGSATAYATYKDVAFTDQGFYIGTTSVAINRSSASQTLTGVSIDGNAATATNGLTTSNYVSYSAFTGSVTSTYGNFTTPALIMGDAQYGFYVVSGNVYYKSASGGVHYWRNTANSGNTMSLDNSGNLNVSGYLQTTGNLIYPSTYGVTQRLEVSNAANNAWIDGLTIAPGGIVTAYGDSRAPIFYDSNNTAYYIDGASGSKLKYLQIDGDWASSPFGGGQESFTIRSTYASMCQRQTNGALAYWLHHIAGDGAYNLYGGRGATDGSSWDWAYRAYPSQDGNYVEFNTSARAQIFYDRNDTTYYLDPANSGTSLLVAGKVGIGTTSPGAPLEVSGTSGDSLPTFKVTSTTAPNSFNYAGTILNSSLGAGRNYVLFIGKASSTKNAAYIGYNHSGTDGSNTNFLTLGHYASDNLLNILGNGNVGIGTTSPSLISGYVGLNVVNAGYTQIKLQSSASSAGIEFKPSSGNNWELQANTSSQWFVFDRTQDVYRLLINSSGNVGIGTASPSQKLHVVGTAYSDTDFRAPIFYDSNDTGYFLNPNSTSNLNNLRAATISAANHGLTCVYYGGGATPTNGYLITTNIDYSTFNMPTVIIEGYAYGSAAPIHLEIVWYAYNNSWTNLSYTNLGAWDVGTISIGTNASGKVCLHLSNLIYYGRFNIRCIYDGGNAPLEGWTVTDATTSALTRVTTISKSAIVTSITGNSATTTLATKATRANGDFYIDDNYGNTIVGLYSDTKYQGVFTMGNAYKLAVNGSGTGNLYGIAWSHPNAGGVAANLSDHGALIIQNGAFSAAISSSIRCTVDMRTPIYYDSNNTAYYLDPASTSNLNNVTAAGTLTVTNIAKNSTSPIVINSGLSASLGLRVYYDMNLYNTLTFTDSAWNSQGAISGSASVVNITAATATTSFTKYAGYSQEGGSFRAPIFYDSDNTAYYVDPTSTSSVNVVGTNKIRADTNRNFGDDLGWWTHDPYGYGWGKPHGSFRTLEVSSSGNFDTEPALFRIHQWGSGAAEFWKPKGTTLYLRETPGGGGGWFTRFYLEGYGETNGSWRAPIFYDSNDTAYYIDAGSTSYLYVLSVASAATAADYYTAGWFRSSASGNGMYNQVTGQHFYSDSVNYWNVASSASTQGIRFRTGGHAGTVRGYIIADTNNDVGLLNQDGNWRVRVVSGDYTIFDGSSIRAQIFYDSNDTGYYTDPAGTSILNVVRANSYVQKSASQSLSGTVGCTIDVAAAGIHVLTLAASTTISSFTYNYRAPNPSVNTIMLVIKYGGTASITWTNVLWANGVTPTITGVSGYADVYMLTSYQGTTGVWIGTVVSQGVVSTSL